MDRLLKHNSPLYRSEGLGYSGVLGGVGLWLGRFRDECSCRGNEAGIMNDYLKISGDPCQPYLWIVVHVPLICIVLCAVGDSGPLWCETGWEPIHSLDDTKDDGRGVIGGLCVLIILGKSRTKNPLLDKQHLNTDLSDNSKR